MKIAVSEEKKVLDACCGSRMFWFDRKDARAVFVDKRRERHTLPFAGWLSPRRLHCRLQAHALRAALRMGCEPEKGWRHRRRYRAMDRRMRLMKGE